MKHEPLLKAAPFSGSRVRPFEGTRRYLSTGDLQETTTSLVEVTYADKPSRADISVSPGDVLFARMKGTRKVLEIDRSIADIIVSTGFAVLRPTEKYNGKFLSICLKSDDFERQKEKYCSGAVQPAITNAGIKKIKVPFPPLDDQKRIAHLLGKVEGLIARRKQTLEQIAHLLKSVFLDMFGNPVRNEKGWEKKTAIDYATCIVPGRDKPKSFTGDIPWVTTSDLVNLGFTRKSRQEIGLSSDEIDEARARVIPAGSVLLTYVGDLGVVSICSNEMVVNQQLHSFQVTEKMSNIFFMFALSFQKSFMYRNASKTTVPYMNKTICNRIPMIAPPSPLQNQFAAIVEKVESLKSRYQQSLADLKSLYGALSQKAFKGELDLSQVQLPTEDAEIAEEDRMEAEDKQHMAPLFELPAPTELAALQTAEGRKTLLGKWLAAWIEQMGDAPFSVQHFMEAAKQWLWVLVQDDTPEWGAAEYDELKAWVFEALEQGRLTQSYDDANNRILITAAKE
jgi:type I restriction enzyme, S subunit